MTPSKIYSFDTSALIHAWRRAYPIENFEGFWENLDELILNGHACCAEEVLVELKKKDDELYAWCRGREERFVVPFDDAQQVRMAALLGQHPRLVDTKKGRSGCDPFVIALAEIYNPLLTVVTQEAFGSLQSPRIPDVCKARKIRCIGLLEVISERDWRFRR